MAASLSNFANSTHAVLFVLQLHIRAGLLVHQLVSRRVTSLEYSIRISGA
jgi:hypothetical protein